VPVHEYQCRQCSVRFDHFFSSISIASSAPPPRCIACDSPDTRRCVSQVAQLRQLSPGVGRAAYPTSWTQTNAGDPETISYWKRRVEREASQESSDPGLKTERSNAAEKRWNDFVARGEHRGGAEGAGRRETVESGRDHVHGHDHPHPHPHPHPHALGATADDSKASSHAHVDTHSHDKPVSTTSSPPKKEDSHDQH
jgi:putative FmdB family regulatory protein